MEVTVTKLPQSKVEVKGTVPAASFDSYVARATKSFVAHAELDGFRKGKAPEKLVIERVGEDKIMHEAAELAMKDEWPKILEEHKIEAIGPAEFHITKIARGNDLGWQAIVHIMPEVTLPDWRALAAEANKKREKKDIEVTDKEVDNTLAYIQKVRTEEGKTPPPLDDAYAQSLGNFSTLEALKNNIREGIQKEKEQKALDEHRGTLASIIAEASTIELPDILVREEQEKMIAEMKHNIESMGLSWNDYLSRLKKTEPEIRDGYAKDAERRVKVALTLSEIAKAENLESTDAEITERVDTILRPYSPEEKNQIDRSRVTIYAKGVIRNEKVLKLLESC